MRPLIFALLLGLGASAAAGTAEVPLKNRLAGHASPYLAMHGADPVAWQEWNAETVARARRENKLLFVSSGYFSCHWCHVMQKESYRNPEIARLLNTYFIPVKVDRELNPALDARLIDFVERTQGYSGWPLNVFVTPEGHPLVGMVYVPPGDFRRILQAVHEQWEQDRDSLVALAREAAAALAASRAGTDPRLPPGIDARLRRALVEQALLQADEFQGGFGDQNKFPMAPQLLALLHAQRRDPHPRLEKFLRLTLDQMARLGLRDHLGGGFFRYTVDPGWRVPHFEKMLYDNALLAEVYFTAADTLGEPRYADIARETLDFMLRELAAGDGAFAASLSAVDERGVEGGYYLWDPGEVRRLVGERDFPVVAAVYDLDGPPELDHGHHLLRPRSLKAVAAELKRPPEEVARIVARARRVLLEARAGRRLPRDGKRLAAWNGLALSALAAGARRPGGERYARAADVLARWLATRLWDGRALARARGPAGPVGHAGLEDYALVARGLLAHGGKQWRAAAADIIAAAWRRFHGPDGFRLDDGALLRYGTARTLVPDGPMPSPAAALMEASLELARRRGDAALARRTRAALNVGLGELERDAFWHASYVPVFAAAVKAP